MAEYDEERGSEILDFDAIAAAPTVNKKKSNDPDAEFDGEWGYSLIKSLRGKTTGRRLKRNLFKFGMICTICGFALSVITLELYRNFRKDEYVDGVHRGASWMALMALTSFPAFLMGIISLTAVRHWASLVTNRRLLGHLMRIYMCLFMVMFIFSLWCTCVTFLTFKKVKSWTEDVHIATLFPYYVSTIIFIHPYDAAVLWYIMDISTQVSEMDMGGVIAEPGMQHRSDVADLSDVTLTQSCIFVCAMPLIICIQISDFFKAVKRAYDQYYEEAETERTTEASRRAARKHNKRSFCRRVWRTLTRWCQGRNKKEIKPSSSSQNLAQDLKLAELGQDRETKERLEREKAEADEAERLRLEKLEEETQLERDRLAAMEAMEQQQREAERLRAEEEAKNAAMRAELEKKEMETKPVLTVFEFKALWSKLSTTGSFQCKLKELPGLIPLTNHLKKQGFHVVFAASPTSSDVEIGVCNIRRLGNEPWFMTRFLATPTSFSAVMKAEDATQVTAFVKKFALAKVLKIDGAIK